MIIYFFSQTEVQGNLTGITFARNHKVSEGYWNVISIGLLEHKEYRNIKDRKIVILKHLILEFWDIKNQKVEILEHLGLKI